MNKKNNVKMSYNIFKEYVENKNYDENIFKKDGSLNENYNSFKKTGTIAKIFEEHFDSVYENNKSIIDKYRPNASKEVKKIIDCYKKNLGFSVYECLECKDLVFIGNTCKSRLCSSCGYKYKLERVENIITTAYRCNHRQIVFTIPKQLRKYFFYPFKERVNILFEAVTKTFYSLANNNYKKNNTKKKKKQYKTRIKYTPGFFSFLHTFGRDIKWNIHIHVLVAEIKLGSDGSVKKWEYFNYDALSKRFQKILLDLLSENIGKEFDKVKKIMFINFKNGFYVYAEKKKFKDLKSGIEYVTRYCGRPPISENRILDYDGENVTFCYNKHEDESYHEVTVPAEKFILMMLRHLIPNNFKIIRYNGFYRKKHIIHDKMVLLIAKITKNIRKTFLKHSMSIELSFKRNPYNCPRCGMKMNYAFAVT